MSYLKIGNIDWSIEDTGFGDRMRSWTNAYILNKSNNFKFTILVDEHRWRETRYLEFPYTTTNINHNFDEEITSGVDYEVGIIGQIKLKDKSFEDKIKKLVEGRVGIHIRHWPNVDFDPRPDKVERFNYTDKMKLVREILDRYPNSKFYISSNVTYDKPAMGPCLPDFRKESHWISQVYKDYDVVDYRNILELGDMLPNVVQDTNNPMWSKVLDDEGFCINTIRYDKKEHKIGLNEIEEMVILRNIIDVFGLIYSKEFISSSKTGPHSSWSEFVETYRENIW